MAAPAPGVADRPTPGSPADEQPDADPVEVAKTIVLRQLSVGPRTRSQLADVLRRKGVPDHAAEAALDRFTELGYVDDEAYAAAWVRSRHTGKGLSRRALEQELSRRGVAVDVARAAAAEVDADDERAAAQRLVRKKLPSLAGVDAQTRVRRLVAMLGRKGYSPGLAASVVRGVLADDAELLDDPDL